MKIFFGTVSNDDFKLRNVLCVSRLPDTKIHLSHAATATEGWNELLDRAEPDFDVAVLCHHDVFFPEGWLDNLKVKLSELPDDWMIAGFFGINLDGEYCGKIHDMRVPLALETHHKLPTEALTIDGCAFAVKLNKGFRFEELPGFDLYDAYMIWRAKELGGTCWIVDNLVEHYASRAFDWKPGDDFILVHSWLQKRFPGKRVITTCYRD